MIEMRQLVYLDAVYRYKNFTRASKALYVSQPTISAAVRSMEQELGLTLVERTPRAVVFTDAGEALMKRIRKLLSDYNDFIAEANDMSRKSSYTLRLGIASILSSDIFPLLYRDFLTSHKELTIRLDEDSAHGHIRKLLDEDLDLAFNGLADDLDTNELRSIPVCSREIKLIMRSDHPLTAMDVVPIETLAGENVSMLSASGVMGQVLEKAFSEHGVQPNVVSEHSQIHGMLEMVLTGCSIGFLNLAPGATTMRKYENLVLRSFEMPLSFTVGFMLKKGKYLPTVCRELIRFISDTLAD